MSPRKAAKIFAQSLVRGKKSISGDLDEDSSDDSDASAKTPFRGRDGASSDRHAEPLKFHHRCPGKLSKAALEKMEEYVGQRFVGSELPAEQMRAIAVVYLNTVFFGLHSPGSVGLRNAREMRTLCLAIDLLLTGQTPKALDVLFQRLKALERVVSDGSWAAARWMELIPTGEALLVPRHEMTAAAKDELHERKLAAVLKPNASAGAGAAAAREQEAR